MSPETQRLFQAARELCLSHEGVLEKLSHGSPAFFLERGGQFAALWDNHHGDGNTALLLAQPPGAQEMLIASDPDAFYRPPYVGPSGWVGIRLDKIGDWSLVGDLIAEAYRFVGAKRKRPAKSK